MKSLRIFIALILLLTIFTIYKMEEIGKLLNKDLHSWKFSYWSNKSYYGRKVDRLRAASLEDHRTFALPTGSLCKTPIDVYEIPHHEILNKTLAEQKCASQSFMTINDKGGLGNKICQYFSLLSLQIKFGVPVAISTFMQKYMGECFLSLSAPNKESCSKEEIQSSTFFEANSKLVKLENEKRNSNANATLQKSTYIANSPCPTQTIAVLRRIIRKEVILKTEILMEAKLILQSVKSNIHNLDNDTQLVSVHARRGDYIQYLKHNGLELAPLSYYENAFRYFRARFRSVAFLVFSMDMQWCEENLSHPDVYFVGNGIEKSPILDFACMSLCDHHIISDGTFGFTSAILGRGLVAYHSQPQAIKRTRNGFQTTCPHSREFIPITTRAID